MAVRKAVKKKAIKKTKVAAVSEPAKRPYIPQDQLTGNSPNRILAADVLELMAFFSKEGRAALGELTSALEIGQDEYADLDEVIVSRDRVVNEGASEIDLRKSQIGTAYPFELTDNGAVLSYLGTGNWGRTLYVLSLLLSHLPSESEVLKRGGMAPTDPEIVQLRRWFQYCATASVAAEIGGRGWAFGWPRPDGSHFLDKLKEIWEALGDGEVRDVPQAGGPVNPKDDEIDIIAARPACDGSSGFPIVLGQVASGGNWKSKSLRGHADHVFFPEWFSVLPGSQALVYHVVPFVIEPQYIRRETRRLGHLLHRGRLCARALEAAQLLKDAPGITIEGTASFGEVNAWADKYIQRFQAQ